MTERPAPQANGKLWGHEAAEASLGRAWRAGRMPHGWLLTGPEGVGKATLAFRFARAYLAGPGEADAAQEPRHPVFRMVASGGHPDLLVLRPRTGPSGASSDLKVETVRDALVALRRTSAGGRRVCLIDDADVTLNDHGENALLKILEEPPPGLVFLLVVQRPGRLVATMASRCARLRLHPLSDDLILKALAELAPEASDADRARAAQVANGSIGRALALTASGWAEEYEALLRALAAREVAEPELQVLPLLARHVDQRAPGAAVALLALVLQRAIRLAGGRPPRHELCAGEDRQLAAVANRSSIDHLLRLAAALDALTARAEALNLDPLQAMMQIVHGICRPEPSSAVGLA